MTLGVPIIQMDDIRAAEGTRAVKLRSFFGGTAAKSALPFSLLIELVGVKVGVGGFVAHEPHEPVWSFAFDFQNHLAFKFEKSFVDEKKRDENCGDADRDEPFVADVARWLECQALLRKLLVKLLDKWLQFGGLKLEAELRDALLQQLFIRKIHPGGRFHQPSLACKTGRAQVVRWGFHRAEQSCLF